jgi:YYY domain-containing protein
MTRDYKLVETPGQPPQKQMDPIESINEFPAFSFYLADLHPHVMALPLWALALAAAAATARRVVRRGVRWRDGLPAGPQAWLSLVLVAIIVGSLYVTNTWDYPTFLLVTAAAVALPYLAFQRTTPHPNGGHWLRPWLVQTALITVLSLVTFLPFHLTFKSLVGSQPAQLPENLANIPMVGWVLQKLGGLLLANTWDKGITGFLMIFGIFLVAIIGWLLYELADYARRWARVRPVSRDLIALTTATAFVLALAVLLRFPLLALLLPLTYLAVYLVWVEPEIIERNVVLVVVATAALIGLTIEVVYLRDVFNSRQNTIFKFYYQIWVLWALASAYGVWRVLNFAFAPRPALPSARTRIEPEPGGAGPVTRAVTMAWALGFGLLVLSGLMYTGYTFGGRLARNEQLRGLDGMEHLARSAPTDYQAIKWLRANADGSEVVLECCRDEYNNPGHAGRVSAYSGIPTLISWDGHEVQWRGGQPELLNDLGRRRAVVTAIYQGVDPSNPAQPLTGQRLLEVLRENNIDYVFVGAVERGEGAAAGAHPDERVTEQAENLFRQVLTPVFTSGNTVIYRVPGS